jgi:hypothetical protein
MFAYVDADGCKRWESPFFEVLYFSFVKWRFALPLYSRLLERIGARFLGTLMAEEAGPWIGADRVLCLHTD